MDEYIKALAQCARRMADWLDQLDVDDEEADVIRLITAFSDLGSEAGIYAVRMGIACPPEFEMGD